MDEMIEVVGLLEKLISYHQSIKYRYECEVTFIF